MAEGAAYPGALPGRPSRWLKQGHEWTLKLSQQLLYPFNELLQQQRLLCTLSFCGVHIVIAMLAVGLTHADRGFDFDLQGGAAPSPVQVIDMYTG